MKETSMATQSTDYAYPNGCCNTIGKLLRTHGGLRKEELKVEGDERMQLLLFDAVKRDDKTKVLEC